jgi:hypothetical protein
MTFLTRECLPNYTGWSIKFFKILASLGFRNILAPRMSSLWKQWSPPLGSNLPWALKCYSCNSIATNEHLKDLTHMFYFWIPCYKLYKEGLFSYVFTLRYMCHFGMSWKKLNLNAKHKIKIKISCLFFSALSFVLSYLLTYLGK